MQTLPRHSGTPMPLYDGGQTLPSVPQLVGEVMRLTHVFCGVATNPLAASHTSVHSLAPVHRNAPLLVVPHAVSPQDDALWMQTPAARK